MAEQQEKAGNGAKAAVSTMATPIFDELLREMTAQRGSEPASTGRRAKPVESKHRAT